MCHLILSSLPDKSSSEAVVSLQRMVVEVLSCTPVSKVLLKLACIDAVILHALMANEVSFVKTFCILWC